MHRFLLLSPFFGRSPLIQDQFSLASPHRILPWATQKVLSFLPTCLFLLGCPDLFLWNLREARRLRRVFPSPPPGTGPAPSWFRQRFLSWWSLATFVKPVQSWVKTHQVRTVSFNFGIFAQGNHRLNLCEKRVGFCFFSILFFGTPLYRQAFFWFLSRFLRLLPRKLRRKHRCFQRRTLQSFLPISSIMFFAREPTNVNPRDFSMVFPDHFSVEGRFAYFCHFFPGCSLGMFAGVRKFSNKHRTTKIYLLTKGLA